MIRLVRFMWGVSPVFVLFVAFDVVIGGIFLGGLLLK
jgi:hypothetical protein